MFRQNKYGSYTQKVHATEICIYDNNEVMIDGAQQILEYSLDNVKISLGKTAVNICGDNLCIRTLSCHQLVVCGCVLLIEFCQN